MIDGIITAAPLNARVVVAGVCMEPDRFQPVMAINEKIDLRFANQSSSAVQKHNRATPIESGFHWVRW